MDLGLRGRTAVVGGATSGLGRASAEALAAEGCDLLLWSRRPDALASVGRELRNAHGIRVEHVAADATDPTAAATIAEAASAFGEIDTRSAPAPLSVRLLVIVSAFVPGLPVPSA